MRDIAIVGGGPAGALCGERLASAGFNVTLFDERLAWEKPCGGGLTHKAIEAYPFLLNNAFPKRIVQAAELISSGGHRARFQLAHPIVIYARKVLNGLLLDRAVAAGCTVMHTRVTALDTALGANSSGVRLTTPAQTHSADFVVIAGGARNQLLPQTTPLGPADLEMTMGYFVPLQDEIIKVKFLKQFEGYIWSFPRADHLSVGICGKMNQTSSQVLRKHLDDFIREENISTTDAKFYGHVLPSPQAQTLRSRRIVGKNWGMGGDAAACVDPVTGEGLYYALRSGDLLAQALIAEQPEVYPERLRVEFSADLEIATRIARKLFRGRFLGGAVTTRMVQMLNHSPTFRDLIQDVFSGAQDYRSLKRRLWTQLGFTLTEIMRSFLNPQKSPSVSHPLGGRESAS